MRESTYGPEGMGFDQSTLGELVRLIYHSNEWHCGSPDFYTFHRMIKELINPRSGKTLALPVQDGLFVDDDPDVTLIYNPHNYEEVLRNRLSSREEDGIIFSENGLVRFTPSGFGTGEQKPSEFMVNRGLIAIVGNSERAEMIANLDRSGTYGLYFAEKFETGKGKIIVPAFSARLTGLSDSYFCVDAGGIYHREHRASSFGVRRSLAPQGDAQKTQ